jgi:hypothetical protein
MIGNLLLLAIYYLVVSVSISIFTFLSQIFFTLIGYSVILYIYPNKFNLEMQNDELEDSNDSTIDLLHSIIEGGIVCCTILGGFSSPMMYTLLKVQALSYLLTLCYGVVSTIIGSKSKKSLIILCLIFLLNLTILCMVLVRMYNDIVNLKPNATILAAAYLIQFILTLSKFLNHTNLVNFSSK